MFTIKKIHLHCTWSLDAYNENCSICRSHTVIIDDDEDDDDNDDNIVIGKCGHVFHETCIYSWVKVKNVCPLCNKKWEIRK